MKRRETRGWERGDESDCAGEVGNLRERDPSEVRRARVAGVGVRES